MNTQQTNIPSTRISRNNIFIYGPSGSGKSTVGKILAESIGMAFVDLDLEIESQSGMDIPQIFASEGESGFREREFQALQKALTSQPKVIALGGGALTTTRNRGLTEGNGHVILLDGSAETLLSRLRNDTIKRPLLNGDSENNLRSLLEKRKEHYASFPIKIKTDGKSPNKVAWDLQVALGIFYVRGMESRKHPAYHVRVHPDGLDALGEMLQARDLRGPVVVVTDDHVGAHYLSRTIDAVLNAGYDTHSISISPGEEHKTLDTIQQIWDAFSIANIERGSTIVALGGGVLGDLAGFAAATWLRSVSWVAVPTSLLAMVDASLGGKTGFDLPQGKNLIGAFHPPRLVLADPNVLETLPEPELINGLAEVVKHGVIDDPALFEICGNLTDLHDFSRFVSQAMAVKVKYIEEDPYEKGVRAALNLGHTVGHGVELASGFQLRHGEAVAIGMAVEARMAEQIGLAAPGLVDKIEAVFWTIGLPTEIPPDLDRRMIADAMLRDKKKAGGIVKFALPVAIGQVEVGVEIENWRSMISS